MRFRNRKTYNGRTNGLVDTLEGQDTISQILVVSHFIEEGTLDGQKLLAWVFAKNMVEEVFTVSKHQAPFRGEITYSKLPRHLLP